MRVLPRLGAARKSPVPLVPLALAMAACAPVQAKAASPIVTTEPSVRPGFSQAVSDYVVRCPDRSLTVAVRRAPDTRVTVDGRRTREQRTVPIEPGQAVPIIVRQQDRVSRHFVRCLPDDFLSWRYHRRGGVQTPRWYLLSPGPHFLKPPNPFGVIFDHHGVPVWWLRPSEEVLFHDLRVIDGNIGYAEAGREGKGFNFEDPMAVRVIRPDGRLVRSLQTVDSPTDFHDLEQVGRDYLFLTYRQRPHVDLSPYGGPEDATVLDSEIQRINRRGRLVWSWSSRDHIDLAESVVRPGKPLTGTAMPDGSTVYDMTHINSVEPVGRDDLIISLRNTDAVYRISMRDGHIRWKLGGKRTPRSLRVVGDPADYPLGFQHDARLWRGTVTVFDNGTDLGGDGYRPPRVVRYEIDTKRRRAILRERLRDPRVTGESLCCGSARKLGNGNWVVGWGGGTNGTMSVLTPRGRVISRLTIDDGFFSYRAVPARAGAISAASLRAGMDALYAAGEADSASLS